MKNPPTTWTKLVVNGSFYWFIYCFFIYYVLNSLFVVKWWYIITIPDHVDETGCKWFVLNGFLLFNGIYRNLSFNNEEPSYHVDETGC